MLLGHGLPAGGERLNRNDLLSDWNGSGMSITCASEPLLRTACPSSG